MDPTPTRKEQLGGYYIIEAPDLDAASRLGGALPGAGHGVVEVRPVWSRA